MSRLLLGNGDGLPGRCFRLRSTQNPCSKSDCRLGRAPSRERAKPEPKSPANVAGEAEVTMLIAMPSHVTRRRLPIPLVSQREPVVNSQRSEYAVGVSQAHYPGGAERSALR